MSILIVGRIVTSFDEEEYYDTVMWSASEIKRVSSEIKRVSSSSEEISDQSVPSSCSGTSKEAKDYFASCAFHS